MDKTLSIESINASCNQCGTINRINLVNAATKISACAKCGQELTHPDQLAANVAPAPSNSSIGFWSSFILVSSILIALRYGLDFISDPQYRKYAIVILIGSVISFKSVRAVIFKATLFLLLLSTILFCLSNWNQLKKHNITTAEGAIQIWRIFSGYGPVKEFGKRIQADQYRKYVDAIDVRNEQINILAAKLTEGCADGDQGCQAQAIALHVSTNINYRSDPISGPDYIKSPLQTLAASAGDCEDKTILLSSLLGTIGIPTHLIFQKDHVYPRACFPKRIDRQYLDSDKVTQVGKLFCYDIETTAKWTGLGVDQHDEKKIEAIIDVKTKSPL
jgi:hypothetical protein